MKKIKTGKIIAALAGSALLTACAVYPVTEADYGDSVRHMVTSQTANPGSVDTSPVETGDGERINGVLEAYRTDVTRTEGAPPPVAIQFGGGAPQGQ